MPNPSSLAKLRGKLTALDRAPGMVPRSISTQALVGRLSVLQAVGRLLTPGAPFKAHALPGRVFLHVSPVTHRGSA